MREMAQTVCLVVLLALGILAAPLTSEAQRPVKVPVIGMLTPAPAPHPIFEAFRQGLHALGYIEGQNITLEYRFADGRFEQLPNLATELVQRPVDVLVTDGNPAILAAKHVTQTIPIVMATSVSPVERGLVDSLARPGGNVTGLAFQPQELMGKRVELLREAVPGVTRIACLWHPTTTAGPAAMLQETERAACALGVQLQSLAVRGPEEFDRAFAAMTQEHADAFMTMPSAVSWTHRIQIVALATKHRLQGIFPDREFAEAGGLMTYGPSVRESFRRAATFVDKILKGVKPADLPVEQPMKLDLVINLKTAKALGLTISSVLLFQADEVLQ
jgi:putative ABC transport system substrate-binding protein